MENQKPTNNQQPTFDELPKRVHQNGLRLEELKNLVLIAISSKTEEQDIPNMDVNQAAEFLKLKVPTIYSKVSRGEIPCMKRSCRLYFSRKDLIAYLKEGRRMTNSEIDALADSYMTKKTSSNT